MEASPTPKKYFLSRPKMAQFLFKLEEGSSPGAVSLYLRPGLSETEFQNMASLAASLSLSLPDELIRTALKSANGAVIFWGSQGKYLVLPPFPVEEKTIFDGYAADPLSRMVAAEHRIGLVLVHLGSYAVGVCQGETLLSSKVGTGLVHGRHKKGGSSQQRFQRRREKQVDEFLDRVCRHAREQLEPLKNNLDYLVFGGPRQTVLQLRKKCSFLGSFNDRLLPLLDVPTLRQKVLERAVGRVWSSYIMEWPGEG